MCLNPLPGSNVPLRPPHHPSSTRRAPLVPPMLLPRTLASNSSSNLLFSSKHVIPQSKPPDSKSPPPLFTTYGPRCTRRTNTLQHNYCSEQHASKPTISRLSHTLVSTSPPPEANYSAKVATTPLAHLPLPTSNPVRSSLLKTTFHAFDLNPCSDFTSVQVAIGRRPDCHATRRRPHRFPTQTPKVQERCICIYLKPSACDS